jgi:hypothetical protein
MAYDAEGLVSVSVGGAVGTAPGNRKNIYHYATNDADTVVETDGYFDGILGDGLNVGDIIIASLDVDGTPEIKMYIVTVGGADVTVAAMPIA